MAADDLPEMIADKRALNQILLNLLSNAIRFTDRGGKVTVSVAQRSGGISPSLSRTTASASAMRIWRGSANRISRRVRSYDRRHGGTGLGLSIVKGLVRLHGGEMDIRSRVGEGTRVTVRLPLDCERYAADKNANGAKDGRIASQSVSNLASKWRPHPASAATTREVLPHSDILVKKSA